MISFNNVSKSFSIRELFTNVSFNINPKERIGLVGRNGEGKTTLLKMIIGTEEVEVGNIAIPNNYTIGYLSQHIAFSKPTVLEEAMTGFKTEEDAFEYKAEKILFGLGFTDEDMNKDPSGFSGGYQVRLNLAKVLLSEPNMLLLDEPTNYLDILSIRWLKSFLKSFKGEIILITHDRFFMDDVITHTVGIHRKAVKKIAGKTEKYYEQIAKDEEVYDKTRINDEQKRKEMEQYITRFRAKARLAGLVQSRIKALNKMEKKEQLDEIKTLEFTFRYFQFNAKHVMRADEITFGYNKDLLLINKLSIIVGSEDRIAIIGKNGRGKSTLLRILSQELKPDSGTVTLHNGAKLGYFEQTNIATLNPNNTVEEEISRCTNNYERTYIRSICGAMLFTQDDALKKIAVLSGGEKSRVMLGKIVATPLNLIMLDEPTNHLDMDSVDSLIEAINAFQGAVIFVTHNEMMLRSTANRLIVFQGEQPFIFDGSYDEFLEKIGFDDEVNSKVKKDKKNINPKDIKKQKSDLINEKSKRLKPIKECITNLESEIDKADTALKKEHENAIIFATEGNALKVKENALNIKELERIIENRFSELISKTEEFTRLEKELDERIAEVD